jgi:2-polyprenyl-6-methoxyphenol hydroxylase-like FAD-dependent oxidoreductase
VRTNCDRRLHAAGTSQDEVFEVFSRCDRFIEVGLNFRTPRSSGTDSTGGCTLVGDGTFMMFPPLSAGANRAIQDAQALAVAIAGIGSAHATLGEALKQFERKQSYKAIFVNQSSPMTHRGFCLGSNFCCLIFASYRSLGSDHLGS